jgi:molecular chaperone DnaK (HSP70)
MEVDDNLKDNLTNSEKKEIDKVIEDTKDWLDKNKNASGKDLLNKNKEVKDQINPIIERAEAKAELNNFAEDLKNKLNDEADPLYKLSKKDKGVVKDQIMDIKDWIKENPKAKPEEIRKKKDTEEEKIKPLLNRATKRANLEDYGNQMRRRLDENDLLNDILSNEDKKKIKDAIDDLNQWLLDNPNATEEEIDKKKKGKKKNIK